MKIPGYLLAAEEGYLAHQCNCVSSGVAKRIAKTFFNAFPAADVYAERAPINAADQLSCPVLLLQGDEDKVVPPNQAETMYAALKSKGIPTALKMYEGEQHGFRKAENIQDALNSELFFYSKVFGFKPAGNIPSFEIENLVK